MPQNTSYNTVDILQWYSRYRWLHWKIAKSVTRTTNFPPKSRCCMKRFLTSSPGTLDDNSGLTWGGWHYYQAIKCLIYIIMCSSFATRHLSLDIFCHLPRTTRLEWIYLLSRCGRFWNWPVHYWHKYVSQLVDSICFCTFPQPNYYLYYYKVFHENKISLKICIIYFYYMSSGSGDPNLF